MPLDTQKWNRRLLSRFKQEEKGATAVEFALLAIPFIALLFSIIELAVVFFIGSTLNHAMSESAREIRTGEFQSTCQTEADFKALICQHMGTLGNCQGNLRFDVVSTLSGDFEPGILTPTPTNEDPMNPGNPIISNNVYTNTGPKDVVIVRAQYYHPLSIPGTFTRLANQPGNTRVISTTTAFRNEPFPNGC